METKLSEKYISINKKDELTEIWTTKEINKHNNKFIEIIESSFPPVIKEIFANNTIDRGFLVANKAMKEM